MIKTFTHDDLLRYFYRETSDTETKELEHALLCDPGLLESFKDLKFAFNSLDSLIMEPSERPVENILNYSKALNCHSIN